MVFGWGKLPFLGVTKREEADINCFSGESEQSYNDVQQSDNQSSFGHEMIAGAASFGAFKIFEDRQRKEGMLTVPFWSWTVFSPAPKSQLASVAQGQNKS